MLQRVCVDREVKKKGGSENDEETNCRNYNG